MGTVVSPAAGAEGAGVDSQSSKRVVLISPYAPSIVSFRGALIRELVQRGHAVYVLAPDYTPEIRVAVQQLGAVPVDYPLDRTGIRPSRDLPTLISLGQLLKRLAPDVVVPYNIKPVIYGTLAARWARCPQRVALIEGLGYAFTASRTLKQKTVRLLAKWLYRLALRYAHKVIFLNPDDQQEFLQGRITDAEKTVVLGGIGVDLREWQPAPPVLEPVTFTLAARLLREKGIAEFAQAARVVKRRYPKTRFLLLGGTDSNPGALAEAEVQAWVEEGILEWLGHVPDVRPYFVQTSVYVLPSYREGVPRSTQEAMAMARPVITTDAPGCRETVIDGVNGFLVPPRDVEALAQAMERFIQQPELIITMGQASRKLAEEKFDVHKVNHRLLAFLGLEEPLPADGNQRNKQDHDLSGRSANLSAKTTDSVRVSLSAADYLPQRSLQQSLGLRLALVAPYAASVINFRGSLIRDFVARGCTVYVFAPDYTPEIRAAIARLGAVPIDYPLSRTGLRPSAELRTLISLWHSLRELRPEIALFYNIKPIVYGTLAAWLARIPRRVALVTGLGYVFSDAIQRSLMHRLLRQVAQALYGIALRRSTLVCFQNPDDMCEFVQRRLVAARRAVLVGATGVELDVWSAAPPVLEPITFTLAARLLREKGVVEFAQAARIIKQRYPNTRFLLLGGIDNHPDALTEAEVQAWAREGVLEWLGHVPDVRPYFAQTSVYVLPSYYREGVPRSTQEAMAMARPVITTDAPGCRETVIDGVNGFLVPPRDVEALAQAMERFIQQPELIITMGQASRQLAKERFDVHRINQKFLQVLGIPPS